MAATTSTPTVFNSLTDGPPSRRANGIKCTRIPEATQQNLHALTAAADWAGLSAPKGLSGRGCNRTPLLVAPASDALQLNQNVYVHLGGTDDAVSYPGIVARITESAVSIRFPDLQALPAGATVGSTALLKIPNNCGVQSAACEVLEAGQTPIVYIKVAAPQHLTISQNRKFFRLPLFIKAKLTVKVSKNQALSGKSDPNAMTEDISAGGLRLNSTLVLEVGDTAVIALRLPLRRGEDGDFTSPCVVRRVVANPDKANKPFQIGVEFNSANRRDEDALMAAMFELQRRARGG